MNFHGNPISRFLLTSGDLVQCSSCGYRYVHKIVHQVECEGIEELILDINCQMVCEKHTKHKRK